MGNTQQENKSAYLRGVGLNCKLNIYLECFWLEDSPKSKYTGKQFNFIFCLFRWAFNLIELLSDLGSKVFNRCNHIIDSGLAGITPIFLFELFIFCFESHV